MNDGASPEGDTLLLGSEVVMIFVVVSHVAFSPGANLGIRYLENICHFDSPPFYVYIIPQKKTPWNGGHSWIISGHPGKS